jgi:hypothetical protein
MRKAVSHRPVVGRWRVLDATPALEAIEARCKRRRATYADLLGGMNSALYRTVERARVSGTLTLETAETLADLLDVHPYQLWHDAYDTAALARLPVGADPWEGIA